MPVDLAGGEGLACRVCGDAFETSYDDDTEQWVYVNAVRVRVVDENGDGASDDDGGTAGDSRGSEYATVKASCADIVGVRNGAIRRSLLM